jgi:hypothetical protein
MLVTGVRLDETDDSVILSATVVPERDRVSRRAEYRFHKLTPDVISTSGNAFVAGLLLPAMRVAENLMIEAPVSPLLLRRVEEITSRLTRWRPHLYPSRVLAPVARRDNGGSAIGLFFSGGVDSYYSLLKNIERHPTGEEAISYIIFAFGIDSIYGYDQRYFEDVSSMVRGVARETGKQAIILERMCAETLCDPVGRCIRAVH